MEDYIVFNGVSSLDMGVVMEEMPAFHRAARRVARESVYGRDGDVLMDDGAHDSYQTLMRINVFGADLHAVYKWLSGEGWLVSSDEPEFMAYVDMYEQITNAPFRADGAYDALTVAMTVQPFLRRVNEQGITMMAPGVFGGQGHANALPILRITGSGNITLMINDRTALIDGLSGTIVLDSDAGVAYSEENGAKVWRGGMVTLMDGWPELRPAGQNNQISWSGSVSRVEIQPQWRYM